MLDLEDAKHALRFWAEGKPFVRRLWIFGSRAKGMQSPKSDLDVAVDFDPVGNDEDCVTTWTFEGERWTEELQRSLPWRLQLE